MNLRLPQLVALTLGGLLIFSAVRNVSALDVLKAAVTGSPMPTPGDMPTTNTPIYGPDGKPTGGYLDPQGRYIPPTDSTQKAPPAAPGTPGNPQNDSYVQPYTVPYQVTSV